MFLSCILVDCRFRRMGLTRQLMQAAIKPYATLPCVGVVTDNGAGNKNAHIHRRTANRNLPGGMKLKRKATIPGGAFLHCTPQTEFARMSLSNEKNTYSNPGIRSIWGAPC